MNDDELMTAVRESFSPVRMLTPVEQTVRRGRVLRTRQHRRRLVAGATAAAAVTAIALAAAGIGRPPASPAPSPGGIALAAWTVTTGPHGVVNITVRQLTDPAGLQRALRAAGVPARVVFQAGIPSDSPPLPAACKNVRMTDEANAKLQGKILGTTIPASGFAPGTLPSLALAIYPREIPRGVGIFLAIQSGSNDHQWGWGMDLVQATQACTG